MLKNGYNGKFYVCHTTTKNVLKQENTIKREILKWSTELRNCLQYSSENQRKGEIWGLWREGERHRR